MIGRASELVEAGIELDVVPGRDGKAAEHELPHAFLPTDAVILVGLRRELFREGRSIAVETERDAGASTCGHIFASSYPGTESVDVIAERFFVYHWDACKIGKSPQRIRRDPVTVVPLTIPRTGFVGVTKDPLDFPPLVSAQLVCRPGFRLLQKAEPFRIVPVPEIGVGVSFLSA